MVYTRKLSIGLIQMRVGMDVGANLRRAADLIKQAVCKQKDHKINLVTLPECFNSPYGIQFFRKYAEKIPGGKTSQMLSEAARKHKVYVVGGTIPENDNGNIYNTCSIWDDSGKYLGKYRKMHLYDMEIPGRLKFKESEVLKPGNELFTFKIGNITAGLGICYDLRFNELPTLYRQRGCELLVYPSAWNAATGPLHWELLIRSRALDSQCFMCAVSPARNKDGYISYGHTSVVDPWGQILKQLGNGEDILYQTLDFKKCDEVRSYISTYKHKRPDIYQVIDKKSTSTMSMKC